jgi:ABC-type multidrug transport system permease subunit
MRSQSDSLLILPLLPIFLVGVPPMLLFSLLGFPGIIILGVLLICVELAMMIFILMGGLYTSIDSMPYWAQVITRFNPITYFIEVMRMVVLKGSGLADIIPQILTMLLFAVVLNTLAILNYRKRS